MSAGRLGSTLVSASHNVPAPSFAAMTSTRGSATAPCVYHPDSKVTGTKVASWNGTYILNTWYVGVRTIFSLSVMIIACSTLTICAMLAMRTRSARRAKMFRLSAARTASRRLFCCTRNPGLLPGSGAYQPPHSSTTSATFFSGSYLSMIAECSAMSASISSVFLRISAYSGSPKPTDLWAGGHFTTV